MLWESSREHVWTLVGEGADGWGVCTHFCPWTSVPNTRRCLCVCLCVRSCFPGGRLGLPSPGAGVGSSGHAQEPLAAVLRWVLIPWTFKGVLGTLQAVSGGEAPTSTPSLFPLYNSGVSQGPEKTFPKRVGGELTGSLSLWLWLARSV